MIKDLPKLLISIVVCQTVGVLGAFLTSDSISNWYTTLNKPIFSPPNWIFGPVWTLLYLLMAISFYLIWKQNIKKQKSQKAINLFAAQLFFNFLWSPVFFGSRSPLSGLIIILTMWTLIILTIVEFSKLSKTAAYLLFPYLFWVSFATVLNLAIVLLN